MDSIPEFQFFEKLAEQCDPLTHRDGLKQQLPQIRVLNQLLRRQIRHQARVIRLIQEI
jgi:hypothetical protein